MPHAEPRGSAVAAWIAAAAGALLIAVSSALAGGGAGIWGFALWALLPYGLLLLLSRVVRDVWAVGGAGLVAVVAEAGLRAGVFLFPTGSTAAIALVFSPIWIAVLALPVGALAGWLVGALWRAARPAGLAGAAAALVGVALLGLGLARPDLLPWAVRERAALLERIGEPRVVRGAADFESRLVWDRPAWFQAADLDGAPGDEIAVVSDGAVLLDPEDFSERGRLALSTSAQRWSWFSVLVRLDGRPAVVQTGGGYSETEVRELDGRLIWRHRPDPALPPQSLRPADLDGDGALEFYSAEGNAVARLDGAGGEVWRRPTGYGAGLLLSGPRTGDAPAWVAALLSDRVEVWDETGRPLGRRPVEPGVVGIADLAAGRALVRSERGRLTAERLDGARALEIDLGDFLAGEVRSVRFEAGAEPHLAVAASAPRGIERGRLLVVAPGGGVVYDEVLDRPVGLLVARRADGGETLLLVAGGLRALLPRTPR